MNRERERERESRSPFFFTPLKHMKAEEKGKKVLRVIFSLVHSSTHQPTNRNPKTHTMRLSAVLFLLLALVGSAAAQPWWWAPWHPAGAAAAAAAAGKGGSGK